MEFNFSFQHKYGYIRDKMSGVVRYLYAVKKGERYINLNSGRLFLPQPPNSIAQFASKERVSAKLATTCIYTTTVPACIVDET